MESESFEQATKSLRQKKKTRTEFKGKLKAFQVNI